MIISGVFPLFGSITPQFPRPFTSFVLVAQHPLGDLLAYWERRRGKGGSHLALPARQDLNLHLIKSLIGRINVIAVHREPPAMRFVWCQHGTESVLVHGVDRTGKDTSTLRPAYYRELVERHYRECASRGEPTLYEIESASIGCGSPNTIAGCQ
jgi:hypothetical protein